MLSLLSTRPVGRWWRWWWLLLPGGRVVVRVGGTRSGRGSMHLFEIQSRDAVPDGTGRRLLGHFGFGDGAHAMALVVDVSCRVVSC